MMKNTNFFLKIKPGSEEIDFRTNEKYNNILARIERQQPGIRKLSFNEQANAINKYIDEIDGSDSEKKLQQYYINRLDKEESAKVQEHYFGENITKNVIGKGGVPTSALMGTNVFDQTTGQLITENKEEAIGSLLKEGNAFKIEGRPDKSVVAELPAPGLIHATAGDTKIMFQGPQEYVDKDKEEWNWNSTKRDPATGKGEVFIWSLGWQDGKGGYYKDQYIDKSDYEMDETKVPDAGGLSFHILPYENFEDGNVHIGVYAGNPMSNKTSGGNEVTDAAYDQPTIMPFGRSILNATKNTVNKHVEGYGIYNQTNRMLLKDYVVPKNIPSNQRIQYVQAQIYKDASDLLEKKMKLRPDLYK
jgi:hypothetical protein